MRLTALVSVPIAAALIVGAHLLIRVTFQHGAFGPQDTAVVTPVLAMYAMQIPFFVCSRVFYRFLVAMRRTDLIFYCGMLNLGLDIVLNLVLMRWFGVAGIALATSLWTVSTLVFLWYWTLEASARCFIGGGGMIPKPAQYLLRFDDLCPTMDRHRWQRFLPLIEEFGIKPILAVVPDNRDPALAVVEPDPEFWGEMRRMQACGATIGLHGYRHLPASKGSGLLPLHRMTEFAGVAAETQREWIHAGLEILRGRGLNPNDLGCAAPWLRRQHPRGAARGGNRSALGRICSRAI